jgi:trehalose utilization protein
MHTVMAEGLREYLPTAEVTTATLQEPDHGLTEERLAKTDVLTWWGHMAHGLVEDRIAERVQKRVLEGMGLIVLHSGHYSKVFKRLMGTTCSLTWREADERERLWVCNPGHPIARGIDRYFELPQEEMYGEPFGVPAFERVRVVVPGRRSVPLGPDLSSWRRQYLLFPPRPRNLPDLSRRQCRPGAAQCGQLGLTSAMRT